jgi:hypothetical protein
MVQFAPERVKFIGSVAEWVARCWVICGCGSLLRSNARICLASVRLVLPVPGVRDRGGTLSGLFDSSPLILSSIEEERKRMRPREGAVFCLSLYASALESPTQYRRYIHTNAERQRSIYHRRDISFVTVEKRRNLARITGV